MREDVRDSIGEQLRVRREELGYSLKDAAERTRIRKSYIESLEADRFSSLPGKAYVTGFIKVYAGYLGLDPAPLLVLLEGTPVEPASEPSVRVNSQLTQDHPVAKPTSSGWAAFFVGFVVVLIVGGGLYFLLESDVAETLMEETSVLEKDNNVPEVKADPVDKPLPMVEADQKQVAEGMGGVASVAKEESATPEPPLATIKKTGSLLRMLAVSNGSLIINVDQRKPQEYVLHDGLDLTWKVKEDVFFEMAAAGQARFWLDGVEIELGGRESLQITHAP